MRFSIPTVALAALAFASFATAGPIVQVRDLQVREPIIQERELEVRAPDSTLTLVNKVKDLCTTLNNAQTSTMGLSNPGGVTISVIANVVVGLGNVIGGINIVIAAAVSTTGGITATDFNQLQAAVKTLNIAFTAYISALHQGAQKCSPVYASNKKAYNSAAASAVKNAASTSVLGSLLGGILGAAVSLITSILAPVTNVAIITGLQTVACLMNTVVLLIVPLTAALNVVVNGVVTPVVGVSLAVNIIPTISATLVANLNVAINIFLSVGITL